jgi:riboflavin kinase/FMN adenylyltransferase
MSIRVLHTPLEERLPAPSHVTIGAFDGVHRGHQRLIGLMTEMAHAANRMSVVMTFDPHPGAVLGQWTVPTLSTIEERAALLDQMGVDGLVVLRFTANVAQTPAIQFVEMLRQDLRMEELWMGPDFALGREREGDVEYLRQVGQRQGFVVEVVPPLEWRGDVVSSSRIRAALADGELEEANGCLGRAYWVTGRVIAGQAEQAMGPRMIDIELPPNRLLPAGGIYAGRASSTTQELGSAVIDVPDLTPGARHPAVVGIYLMEGHQPVAGQKVRASFVEQLEDERLRKPRDLERVSQDRQHG